VIKYWNRVVFVHRAMRVEVQHEQTRDYVTVGSDGASNLQRDLYMRSNAQPDT